MVARRRRLAAPAVIALAAAAAVFFTLWPRPSIQAPYTSPPPLVELTLLSSADQRGALCLDGSPPGYHLQRGFGSGFDSWMLHLQGGGWCNSREDCWSRKLTVLGSSRYMEAVEFSGIFSNESTQNPDFYNWNRVLIRYCDGASFSGDVKIQTATDLFFRGLRIWEAVLDELFTKGLANAKQVLLSGCSAGGLATYIHCDDFRARFSEDVVVKCLADGGFFLDVEDVAAKRTMRALYNDVVNLQNVTEQLPRSCVSNIEPAKCIFPAEIVTTISTPLFILNSAYDSWQIPYVLAPDQSDPHGSWQRCKWNIRECSPSQMMVLHGFRKSLLDALILFENLKGVGMFIDSCFVHCQTVYTDLWHSPNSPRLKNQSIAEAVGNWYFGRRQVRLIDGEYPCNPTCDSLMSSAL